MHRHLALASLFKEVLSQILIPLLIVVINCAPSCMSLVECGAGRLGNTSGTDSERYPLGRSSTARMLVLHRTQHLLYLRLHCAEILSLVHASGQILAFFFV